MEDTLAGALGLLVVLLFLVVWDQLVGAIGIAVGLGTTTIVIILALIAGLLVYAKTNRNRSM